MRQTSMIVSSMMAGFVGAGLFLYLFAAPIIFAQDGFRSPTVSSAEEFRLVDHNGTVRAILAMSGEEKPYLALLGEDGAQRSGSEMLENLG